MATASVRQVRRLAVEDYGLSELTAVVTLDNRASMTVLARNGFTAVGETRIDGRPAMRYQRPLGAVR